MIAEREQDWFATSKRFGLVNGVAVTFLLVLNSKADPVGEAPHLFGFPEQSRLFGEALQISLVGTGEIPTDEFVFAGLHDDANLFDTGRVEFEQMIMEQRPRNAVRTDDGKKFFFDGVRRREVPGAEAGNRDDGFANGAAHNADRFQPAAPKL